MIRSSRTGSALGMYSSMALLAFLAPAVVSAAPLAEMLTDLNPSYYTLGSYPHFLGTVGGKAVFNIWWGEPNAFVWITDGTPEGTKALEIGTRSNPDPSMVLSFGTAGSHLFLHVKNNGPNDDQIVAVDAQGTVTTVVEEAETWDFFYIEYPSSHRVAGGKLALALQPASVQETVLLFIDGETLASTVAFTTESWTIQLLGNAGSDLVFGLPDSELPLTTLWRSGGSPETTASYAIVPGSIGSDAAASGLGQIYFSLQSPTEVGTEVWVTNGAASGTGGLTSFVDQNVQVGKFHLDGDRAYFLVTDATFGQELFTSDGQLTRAVTNFGYHLPFGYGDASIAISEHRAFFLATDGVGTTGLWLAGDRPENTRLLLDDVVFDSSYGWIAAVDGSAFVPVNTGEVVKLMVSDGTVSGTHEVSTGCTSPCDFYPRFHSTTSSTLYFTAQFEPYAYTIYATRPPFEVAVPLYESLEEGPVMDTSAPPPVAVVGEKVFFAAAQLVAGSSAGFGEPWVTAGTPATTTMIRRLAPLESSSGASRFRTTAGALALSVDFGHPSHAMRRSTGGAEIEDVEGDYEICFYGSDIYALQSSFVVRDCQNDFLTFDASGGPATRLTDLHSDNFDRSIANGEVVGFLRGAGTGYEVWRIGGPGAGAVTTQTLTPEEGQGDLEVAGTVFVLVRDVGFPQQLFALGDDLTQFDPISPSFDGISDYLGSAELGRGFFAAGDQGGPVQVWTTDGTEAGTVALFPDAGYGVPLDAARLAGEWIVLAAVQEAGPVELQVWRTDGTPGGSTMLTSLPLEDYMEAPRVVAAADWVVFSLRTFANEGELWSVPATGGAASKILPPGVTVDAKRPQLSVVGDHVFFNGCDADHGCELWRTDGNVEGTRLFHDIFPGAQSSAPDQLLTVGNELVFTADDGLHGEEPWHLVVDGANPCGPGTGAHCLDGGRYLVRATWKAPVAAMGDAGEVPMTPDTGGFWFFDIENVELIFKAIDGSGFNGHEWIYYGALSNVEYSVDVTDSVTGEARRYFNPAGRFASGGDIFAFPRAAGADAPATAPAAVERTKVHDVANAAPAGACAPSETTFCILEGRFAVEATWRDFEGNTGVGRAGNLTNDTGFFWFFDDANVELVVKAVDGTELNGQFWIYYGALSNVEYVIRVTDTATGRMREYRNPLGTFGSFGDIAAFPAE